MSAPDVWVWERIPHGRRGVNQSLLARVRQALGIAQWQGVHPFTTLTRRAAKARLTLHRRAS